MNIKNVVKMFKNYKISKRLLSMQNDGYFLDTGWLRSFSNKTPMDKSGSSIPWVTYSFIDFISPRLNKSMNSFEFGSGASTSFYSKYVSKVISVEHDKEWFDRIKNDLPVNAELHWVELIVGGDYSNFLSQLDLFDIIIVDGRDRVNCVKNSITSLSDSGVVVLDDSERDEYQDVYCFMNSHGFKFIDFTGIAPGVFYKKSTTIFYRDNNCLGI